jgi:hypothetical protein
MMGHERSEHNRSGEWSPRPGERRPPQNTIHCQTRAAIAHSFGAFFSPAFLSKPESALTFRSGACASTFHGAMNP